jgi:hypothetical protein
MPVHATEIGMKSILLKAVRDKARSNGAIG